MHLVVLFSSRVGPSIKERFEVGNHLNVNLNHLIDALFKPRALEISPGQRVRE